MRSHCVPLLLVFVAAIVCGSVLFAADTVVVCPAEFRAAIKPWTDYRASQGHVFVVASPDGKAEDIQRQIRTLARQHELKYVVLVGDVPPAGKNDARRSVPTFIVPAKINVLLGGDKEIATDNGYGDLDGDDIPELAVGRLSVQTQGELSTIVGKIKDFESPANFGPWCRRMQFVAGVGGFGAVEDAALEAVARKFITQGVPAAYAGTMTHASWRSPFCPDPREFRDCCCARMEEGALFWVYIGHGSPGALDWVHTPDGKYFPILQNRDVARLQCTQGAPIAVMLACSTCAFDGQQNCLAEELLRSRGGPVAVIGGSRVTMPYGMGVLATHMMRNVFEKRLATVGEVFVESKRATMTAHRDDPESKTLDFMARTLGFHDKLEEERREHLHLFHIIGDPLLRLPLPAEMQVTAPETAAAGEKIEVRWKCPFGGKCVVELAVRRDRLTFRPTVRTAYKNDDDSLAEYQSSYQKANDQVLCQVEVPVRAGELKTVLSVPSTAKGACHVRVLLLGDKQVAIGATEVMVKAGEK